MPLILLGGINRLETVEHALDEGFAFVQMARALLREPDLVRRMQEDAVVRGVVHPLQQVHADDLPWYPLRPRDRRAMTGAPAHASGVANHHWWPSGSTAA